MTPEQTAERLMLFRQQAIDIIVAVSDGRLPVSANNVTTLFWSGGLGPTLRGKDRTYRFRN